MGGESSAQIVSIIKKENEKTQAVSKFEKAKLNEEEGFSALLAGNYALAMKKF